MDFKAAGMSDLWDIKQAALDGAMIGIIMGELLLLAFVVWKHEMRQQKLGQKLYDAEKLGMVDA